jgi:excisionase family DNA binding protein
MSELITINQACRELKVSRGTLAKLRREGRIPFVRVGRGVRIPSVAIESLIAEAIAAAENAERDAMEDATAQAREDSRYTGTLE